MKIDLNSLEFIDHIATSILTSRLSSITVSLTREHVCSIATSSYQFAKVVYQVREDFKKEHGIVEESKLIIPKKEKETPLVIISEDRIEETEEAPEEIVTKPKRGRPKSVLKVNKILNKKSKE